MNVTALCFLFQHGNVNTTLVDNGAGSVTEQKAIEVFSSKHLHDQISSTHKQHNRKFSPVLTVNRHSERAPHPTSVTRIYCVARVCSDCGYEFWPGVPSRDIVNKS